MPVPVAAAVAVAGSPTGRRVVVGALAGLAALIAIFALAVAALVSAVGEHVDAGDPAYAPSAAALADIPGAYLALYMRAADRCLPVAEPCDRLDWAILAAIGFVESGHGAHPGPSSAGALGPMQFMPATWRAMGVDANDDGRRDIMDPEDAIPAAARYLRANGAPRDYHRALLAYNHAEWYVAEVMAKAVEYRGALRDAGAVANLGGPAIGLGVAVNRRAAAAIVRQSRGPDPRVAVYAGGLDDLSAGRVDTRVSTLLLAVGRQHTIYVSSLITGHGTYTSSGNVSNHVSGRAADIAIVDGETCDSHARGRSGRCWQLARQLAAITGPLHPTELIFGIDPDGPGPAFAQSDHSDHIHAGFDG